MSIDHQHIDAAAQTLGGEHGLERGEGIVERIHEQPGHHVDHHDAALADREDADAAPRRAARKIDRTEQARIAVDRGQYLALVPDMIAGGDAVDAGLVEIAGRPLGDPEAMRRVLAVGDDEIQIEPLPQTRQMAGHGLPAGPADDVAEKEQPHGAPPNPR